MMLEYFRVRPQAIPPSRANPSDAGLDVYFCPDDSDAIRILPGDSVVLPTGLKFGVPHGYMLEVKNRSSVAAKRSLIVGAHVIDSGYNGEVFINLHNVGQVTQVVEVGTNCTVGNDSRCAFSGDGDANGQPLWLEFDHN